MHTEVGTSVRQRGRVIAAATKRRAKDGVFVHYHSLEHVPRWKFVAYKKYWNAVRRQVADLDNEVGRGEHWIEIPNHPNPRKRGRRRYA